MNDVHTRTLFIYIEDDYRSPIEQSEQMYTASPYNGVATRLVRFKGDSHEHARHSVPENMKKRLKLKVDWFKQHDEDS